MRSNENRCAADRKWPYRCYEVATAQALDTLLTKAMPSISENAVEGKLELAMLAYGLYMKLPQFRTYAESLPKTPFHRLCPLIHSSEYFEIDLDWITMIMKRMSSLAETACQSPYESDQYCNLPKVVHGLESMRDDHDRAGSSTELKLFAFHWFLVPGLSSVCDDTFRLEMRANVLRPHARSAMSRLNEITQLTSAEGTDLEQIRTFMNDYFFAISLAIRFIT